MKSTMCSRPPSQMFIAAGEPTGIAGLDAALLRATSPALPAPDSRPDRFAPATSPRKNSPSRLEAAFRCVLNSLAGAPGDHRLPLRRCNLRSLAARKGWTDAKLQTRCGMGPCQGRICGPATQTLFRLDAEVVRPPLFPVPCSALCSHDSTQNNRRFHELAGVMPAMTTPFDNDLSVDHPFLAQHAAWLFGNGCTGLVMLGSLGEGATLENAEKSRHPQDRRARLRRKTPVVAAISSLSTANAVRLAKEAEQAGCQALMVLPPYVYTSDWREMRATSPPSSPRPRSPACSTTIPSPTKPTSCPSRSLNSPRSTRTFTR